MAKPSHIVYPIPIREGVVVRIYGLPDDLTKREAERVAAVVLALGEKPMTWPALDGEPEYASWLPAETTNGVSAGCDHCRNPLFVGTECKNCGRTADAPKPKPRMIEIQYELGGRWWHMNCRDKDGKWVPSGIMRLVHSDEEAKRSLIRCLRCNEQGYYQFGWVGLARVPLESTADGTKENGNASR